jgi:tol-pal system protein YbgF
MNVVLRAVFPMRAALVSMLLAVVMLAGGQPSPARAQMSASDMVVRLEQLESQMRQLTGQIEQLQFSNQQLQQQLKRMQDDYEFRFQQLGARGGAPSASPALQAAPPAPGSPAPAAVPGRRSENAERNDIADGPSPIRPLSPGRRSDAFDPNANPNAPGAPRALGALPAGQPSAPPGAIVGEEPSVGVRGGREAGAPLDLSTLASASAQDAQLPSGGLASSTPGPLPPPPQRNPSATGAQAAVAPPTQSARDVYDLGYGYIQRKDYALAEQTLRDFLTRYPADARAPEAQYWLGESLFQRQRYRDAAENFLAVSTKYETTAKAPDALLRLGQSLAALGEKDAACATLGEINRKYPRASLSIKHGVEREQKRVRC